MKYKMHFSFFCFVCSLWFVKFNHRDKIQYFICGKTHQILYHTHPLAAQLCHQAVNIHKIMISNVLNEVVKSNKHTCPAHTGTEGQQENNTLLEFNLIIELQ